MARLIQTINTSGFASPSPDPAGIALINNSNVFVISDSEVNETPIFEGNNLFEVSSNGNLIGTGNVLDFSTEPTGLTYDSGSNTLFISDDAIRRITGINPGNDGTFGTSDDELVNSFNTRRFGSTDPEDLAFSSSSGTLFVADGLDNRIYEVDTSGTSISSFSTSSFGLSDPEGIGFDAESGNLFLVGEPTNTVFEVTTSGVLVREIDISAANPVQPAGIEIANSSDASGRSVYIVDRGIDESVDINENDGRLYEFSLEGNSNPGEAEIAIADASIVEGDNGNNDLNFTVSLTEASTEAVSVDFTTNDGTAIAGEDYLASSGTVTFAPGETSQTITLSIIGDTIVEDPQEETFTVNLSNPSGATIVDDEAIGTITDNDDDGNPGGGGDEAFYATTRDSVNLNGNSFDDEDVIFYNPDEGTWSQYLDGSDLGLAGNDIDGVHVNSDGSVLLSLNQDTNIDGLGAVDDADILRFNPTSTGNDTAGSLELYFDGSDVGLDSNQEDIDGISIASNGDILISTNSSYSIGGLSGDDTDILAFSATSLGEDTTGSFSLYVDGSDIELTDSSEDIKGLSVSSNGEIVLSTLAGFNVPGLSGGGSDLFSFNPSSLGDNTSGTFSLLSSGTGNGLGNQVVADISYGTSFNANDPDPNPDPGGEAEIAIADASIVEGDNGNNDLNFTVSLTEASTEAVSVDFTTNDGTAIAGEDYLASSGTVTFAPGETSQTITLSIIGDTIVEDPQEETFTVNLSNPSGATIVDDEAIGTITDNDDDGNPGGGGDEAFYATTRDSVNLNGNSFDDEDVIFYNPDEGTWSQYLDGSDLGLAGNDIDGVHVNSDGSVLLSLNQDTNIDGLGAVDDADILRFNPTSTGNDTAGSLELYFDGSDVGLDSNQEDIDGISIASNGDILISTNSSYSIGGLSGDDTDILAFSATSLGEDTTGSFSLYVDGSDIELTDSSEDIKGLSVSSNGEIVLSTLAGFNVPGLSGGGSDLFSFNPSSLGDNTSGTFELFASGTANGLGNQVVADISVV